MGLRERVRNIEGALGHGGGMRALLGGGLGGLRQTPAEASRKYSSMFDGRGGTGGRLSVS